jgi:hypothetical protein
MVSALTNIHAALLLGAVALAAVAGPPSARAADGCLANRAAQALVAQHKIKTWPTIKALAGVSDQYKEVSAVKVCEQDGTPYYVVNVAGPSGESKQLVLNAIDGSR